LLCALTGRLALKQFKAPPWRTTMFVGKAAGNFYASADDAPSLPGAYVLVVELKRPLTVALPGKPVTRLSAGRYLYCGSAYALGGLRARTTSASIAGDKSMLPQRPLFAL
jgi:hypothetical protein